MSQTRNRAALSMPLSYANLAYYHYAFSVERGSSSVTSRYHWEYNIHVVRIKFDVCRWITWNKIDNVWFIEDPRVSEKQRRKQQLRCTLENNINRWNKHDEIRSRISRNRVVRYRTPSYSRRWSLYTHVRRFFWKRVSANQPYARAY